MKTWQVLAIAHRGQTSRIQATNWTIHPHTEDLEQLALGKALLEDQLKIELHLRHCDECQRSFEEARKFADRLQDLLRSQGRRDQRVAVRYKVRESAIIAQCSPPDFEPVIGQVMDVSATGLRIRLPRAIHRGTQVQVLVEKAAVFGTIRYCRTNSRNTHDVGLVIDQVVMRPGGPPIESPAVVTERDGTAKPQPWPTARTLEPVEVLLVEDNPADAKLVELLFDGLQVSHRLTVVVDGAQALRRLFDPTIPKPNLILLDLSLPELSGLEVLRKLREDAATVSVSVAVLSGSTADLDVRRATALGIRAYLPKPDNMLQYEGLRHSLSDLVSEVAY
jgi:two-component system, chemotaxis family, response regulator Rcp1